MPFAKLKNHEVKPSPMREIPRQEVIVLSGVELDLSTNEEMRDGPNKKDEVKKNHFYYIIAVFSIIVFSIF